MSEAAPIEIPRLADRAEKRARVRRIMAQHGTGGILLTSPTACSWYLDGARTQVALLGPAVVAVEARSDRDIVHVPANEYDRLIAEELPSDVDVRVGEWYDWMPQPGDDLLTEDAVDAALRAARSPLLPGETDRYRALSHEVAAVLTRAMSHARPDDTERELAARASAGIARIGAEPVVVLVAGSARLGHRHPLPTSGLLGERAMLVVGARRSGLITNLTRWVRFVAPTAQERDGEAALLAVESAFLGASTPGARLGDILRVGARAYDDAGFGPDEWRRHHQGGVAGYAGRDPRATPDAAEVLQTPTAVAWNPSIPAGKVEDTILVSDGRPEVLTVDEAWPTIVVNGIARPAELQR